MMFKDVHFRISNFYVTHIAELKENHSTYYKNH